MILTARHSVRLKDAAITRYSGAVGDDAVDVAWGKLEAGHGGGVVSELGNILMESEERHEGVGGDGGGQGGVAEG